MKSVPRVNNPVLWWKTVLPCVAIGLVAGGSTFVWAEHGYLSWWIALPAAALVAAVIASQLINQFESLALVKQARTAETRVREREQMLNKIIDNAPQGVARISVDGTILNANPRLGSILYARIETLVGARLDRFLKSGYVAQVLAGFGSPPASGAEETYVSDCRATRTDGSQFWLHWSVTPIRKNDGSLDYFMAMFDDVTARREAEETAVANLAQLEQLNRLKSEFVSVVSHEFRTALVGIQGFSELIRDQEMDMKEVRILAQEINDDAQRLSRMITNMLDFDRLEAGKIRLTLEPLDLNELAESAVEHAQASTKTHTIKSELERDLPLILGDGDRLTQVVSKLLSNAIKYSPEGGEILVSTCSDGRNVEIAVKDHGRGIPPEFISRLFGRYERYEDKHAGKVIGTGLGLAIARQIVEMHGGKIAVESALGKGSEFRVCIPTASNRHTEPLAALQLPDFTTKEIEASALRAFDESPVRTVKSAQ